jgi:DNA-binding response OmpR family regulator
VLIIEDDPTIVELLELHLRDIGLHADTEATGSRGLKRALEGEYKLIVLDLMLPGLNGFDVCRKIRERRKTPVLMLTARSEELDKVLGLELGADDYITKPFSIRELLARVKAVIRRTESFGGGGGGDDGGEQIRHGELRIDLDKRLVYLNEQPVELTAKEYDLLVLFARNPGRAYNRQQLLDIVWGYQFEGYQHTVNSHINRLRGKIERDPSNPQYIQTVWGYGYRFAAKAESS